MKSIAYYNGQTGAPEELTIPFNDRSHFFGDGVYDAAMGANGKIFLLEEHLDRFYSSAAAFRIEVPMGRDELSELLLDLLSQVEGPSQFVYWQVTRGISGERAHAFDPKAPGILWVLINQEDMADPQKKLKLITRPDTRFEHCNVKTLNLLPAVMNTQAALEAGADEAVLHRNGIVTECAHSNVLILKDGTLYSHPNDEFILRGIAKTHLIQAAYRAAVPVIERPFTLDELFDADEVIVTASSHLCCIASEIDGEPVGGNDPATIRALLDIVYREYFNYCDLQKLN
ncbi:MAG: aminotransferase class IV [Eggerthellaceae bacterium]|nr:aminotransferase class IV [Eggerthellaceae bacterium]